MLDDNGQVVGFRGADRDITERKLAEEALYETSQRLTLHVENSPLAVVEFDAELKISRWTEESERMFGWSAAEVIGKSLDDLDLVYKEDHEAVETMMEKLRDGKIPRTANKNRNYRKDGSVIYCEWYNSALFDSSGEFVSILSLALDMTEEVTLRRKLENQVKLLQQALVPSEPAVVEDYTTAAIYLPAYVGQEIGGDFYDSFLTENGMIGIVIGDVAGKGVEAASLAAAARSTIRAFAYELSSVSQALSHTNAVLCAQKGDSDKFVTVFAVVIAPVTGEFDYAGAGHPPAAIWRTNGFVEFLGVGNPPVGILDKRIFTSIQGLLNPGDKIVLYTDGILEARRGQEFFELEGIRRTVEEHGHQRPAEVAQELLRAAQQWAGRELQDDAAIFVIERNA
jgi:PAS domain S-box-containing protein